jgi:pimeloyl-ACP methyl ester carboxylesterase
MTWLPGVLASVAVATLLAGFFQQRPSGPPPGILVDIGSHKLHVRCAGPATKTPTVILEAGGGAYSTVWSKMQAVLDDRVRSCAYDRAGLGWSGVGPTPQTMRQEVFELHALLQAGKIPGPYILVGHSIGGLLVRLYADRYGSEVSGIVLAAGTHESARLGVIGKGWVRVREQATGRPIPEPSTRTPPAGSVQTYDPSEDYFAEELALLYRARLANREPLGDTPLLVLAPTRQDPPPPGTPAELWAELRVEKDDQATGLVLLSRNSRLIRDPTSGHQIHADNPQLVARAIEEVLAAAVKGTRLDAR